MRTGPRSIQALLLRLVSLRPILIVWPMAVLGLGLACIFALSSGEQPSESALVGGPGFASFNIEYFPKDQRQIDGAFELIASLNAEAIGVQEITKPELFREEAHKRLGPNWNFVYQDALGKRRTKLHIGVLYNSETYSLESVRSHFETRIDDRTQTTFEARLRNRANGRAVSMLVIHFKALPAGREQRARQFVGLTTIIQGLHDEGRHVIVMGDFNATDADDRSDLETLSQKTGLFWATRDLSCSAFWERQSDCPTSRLDHVLTWRQPAEVYAKGGCEQGCEKRNSCPLYRKIVSDHCPVVVEFR